MAKLEGSLENSRKIADVLVLRQSLEATTGPKYVVLTQTRDIA